MILSDETAKIDDGMTHHTNERISFIYDGGIVLPVTKGEQKKTTSPVDSYLRFPAHVQCAMVLHLMSFRGC